MKHFSRVLAVIGAILLFAAAAAVALMSVGYLIALIASVIPLILLGGISAGLAIAGFRLMDATDPISAAVENAIAKAVNDSAKEA